MRVGIPTYAWYQSVFLIRVKEVYEEAGTAFANKLRNLDWREDSPDHHLGELERLVPGFLSWACHYKLLPVEERG